MSLNDAAIRVAEAAGKLAAAREYEAETFLRLRINAPTDGQAKAQTVLEMKGRMEKAEAEYEIAKAYLTAAAREAL